MKVLMKGITPDGTKIQIEDWSEGSSYHNYGDLVVAYPKIRGISERAEYQTGSNGMAQRVFKRLKNGEAKLTDYIFACLRTAHGCRSAKH